MATAIPEILAKLPERAPEIIREVNPVTWFERVIHEYHEYTLAEKKNIGRSRTRKRSASA